MSTINEFSVNIKDSVEKKYNQFSELINVEEIDNGDICRQLFDYMKYVSGMLKIRVGDVPICKNESLLYRDIF